MSLKWTILENGHHLAKLNDRVGLIIIPFKNYFRIHVYSITYNQTMRHTISAKTLESARNKAQKVADMWVIQKGLNNVKNY